MRRSSLPLLFIPLLLCGVLWEVKNKRDTMPSLILARYPQNATFQRVVNSHLRADFAANSALKPLLITTFFAGGSVSSVQRCYIEPTGKGHKYREAVYMESPKEISNAIQANSEFSLNTAGIQNLCMILAQLPPNEAPGSRGDLVLVSFESEGVWTTRIYNKKALPPQVTLLMLFTGEPMILR